MSRIKLELPPIFHFETSLAIRICELNYGNHLGIDGLTSLMHEARVQWLTSLGYTELNIEGCYITLRDTVVSYQSEAFYGEQLVFRLALDDPKHCQCDLYYEITEKNHGRKVAQAKTNLAFWDNQSKKLAPIPKTLLEKMIEENGG